MKIILATSKAPHNERSDFAMSTWIGADEVREIECARTAADIGCKRGCFYVKDVFDQALALEPDDIFIYLNNDCALASGWRDILVPAVQKFGCAYSHRAIVAKFFKPLTMKDISRLPADLGTDLMAFQPAWWLKYRDEFPEGVFSHEGFDFAVAWYMRKAGFDRIPPILYHEKHASFWNKALNLQHNPVQIVVRKRLTEWACKVGAQKYLGSNYLFKSIYTQYSDQAPYAPMLSNRERKEIQSAAIRLAHLKWKRHY
jgi:hypothetical protein